MRSDSTISSFSDGFDSSLKSRIFNGLRSAGDKTFSNITLLNFMCPQWKNHKKELEELLSLNIISLFDDSFLEAVSQPSFLFSVSSMDGSESSPSKHRRVVSAKLTNFHPRQEAQAAVLLDWLYFAYMKQKLETVNDDDISTTATTAEASREELAIEVENIQGDMFGLLVDMQVLLNRITDSNMEAHKNTINILYSEALATKDFSLSENNREQLLAALTVMLNVLANQYQQVLLMEKKEYFARLRDRIIEIFPEENAEFLTLLRDHAVNPLAIDTTTITCQEFLAIYQLYEETQALGEQYSEWTKKQILFLVFGHGEEYYIKVARCLLLQSILARMYQEEKLDTVDTLCFALSYYCQAPKDDVFGAYIIQELLNNNETFVPTDLYESEDYPKAIPSIFHYFVSEFVAIFGGEYIRPAAETFSRKNSLDDSYERLVNYLFLQLNPPVEHEEMKSVQSESSNPVDLDKVWLADYRASLLFLVSSLGDLSNISFKLDLLLIILTIDNPIKKTKNSRDLSAYVVGMVGDTIKHSLLSSDDLWRIILIMDSGLATDPYLRGLRAVFAKNYPPLAARACRTLSDVFFVINAFWTITTNRGNEGIALYLTLYATFSKCIDSQLQHAVAPFVDLFQASVENKDLANVSHQHWLNYFSSSSSEKEKLTALIYLYFAYDHVVINQCFQALTGFILPEKLAPHFASNILLKALDINVGISLFFNKENNIELQNKTGLRPLSISDGVTCLAVYQPFSIRPSSQETINMKGLLNQVASTTEQHTVITIVTKGGLTSNVFIQDIMIFTCSNGEVRQIPPRPQDMASIVAQNPQNLSKVLALLAAYEGKKNNVTEGLFRLKKDNPMPPGSPRRGKSL